MCLPEKLPYGYWTLWICGVGYIMSIFSTQNHMNLDHLRDGTVHPRHDQTHVYAEYVEQ